MQVEGDDILQLPENMVAEPPQVPKRRELGPDENVRKKRPAI